MVDPLAIGVVAGRFLAPFAATVAKKLANKASYRCRVVHFVRKRADFTFNRTGFQKWMRTVTAAQLEGPVEEVGATFAADLDRWLSRVDAGWERRPEHLSESLRLVEAFYLAVFTLSDRTTAELLAAQWSRKRNEALIASVVEGSSGLGPISAADLAVWLRRRSGARRAERLRAFDIEPVTLADALAAIKRRVPSVSPGQVRILIGGFGAGKSEIAEQWHRDRIERFESTASAALPVWLHARSVGQSSLELTLAEYVGSRRVLLSGVALVLDGLDEVDGSAAESLVRDAMVFVGADPRSSALITSRPGTVPESAADVAIEPLTEDESNALIDRIVGREHVAWEWNAGLKAAIAHPFFALAAAVLVSSGEIVGGQMELVAKLVERALNRGATSEAIRSNEVFDILLLLAVSLTEGGGHASSLPFRESQVAIATRLVAASPAGPRFTLPIFEQWFAAQALISDQSLLDGALATPATFDRWRWALAIAVGKAAAPDVDRLLADVLRFNPGAGAWLLKQAAKPRYSEPAPDDPDIDQEVCERRVATAARAWIDGLGNAGPWLLPLNGNGAYRIRVEANGRRITSQWGIAPDQQRDAVERMPADGHRGGGGWIPGLHNTIAADELWPWLLLRDQIATNIDTPLTNREPLRREGSIWNAELVYEAARVVAGSSGVFHRPISAATVLREAESTLASSPTATVIEYSGRKPALSGSQLRYTVSVLRTSEVEDVMRPTPPPDLSIPTTGVEQFYSLEQFRRFAVEAFGLACVVYEELVADRFGAFRWTLGRSAVGSLGVVGAVVTQRQGTPFRGHWVDYEEVPVELISEYRQPEVDYLYSSNGRAMFGFALEDETPWPREDDPGWSRLLRWVSARPEIGPFLSLHHVSRALKTDADRVASQIAAEWLLDDLRRLGLAGTRGRRIVM